jgi:hypothetical protein
MAKTERLTIKILSSDKQKIERIAELEGEPVAVIVRRLIRNAMQELEHTNRNAKTNGAIADATT